MRRTGVGCGVGVAIILALTTWAHAANVVMGSNTITIVGTQKAQWQATMAEYWPEATPGQMLQFQCSRSGDLVRCNYAEVLLLGPDDVADHESDGRRVDLDPHGVYSDGTEAHCHVHHITYEPDSVQITALESLVSSTFGITMGTCRRFVVFSGGGELWGNIEYEASVSNQDRLICAKMGTCWLP